MEESQNRPEINTMEDKVFVGGFLAFIIILTVVVVALI